MQGYTNVINRIFAKVVYFVNKTLEGSLKNET
jgi:hypothetical protein